MGRLTVEQIISVDGYAADADGGIGFFEAVDEVDSNDADQLAFLKDVDAILLGANTYRMFAGYWPKADPAKRARRRADQPAAEVRRLEHARRGALGRRRRSRSCAATAPSRPRR